MFKKDQIIRCIDKGNNSHIEVGRTYTVLEDQYDGEVLILNGAGDKFHYAASRFELVEVVEVKQDLPMLTLKLGDGIGITLDPNIPFSRKFAEAFLDVVYGKQL